VHVNRQNNTSAFSTRDLALSSGEIFALAPSLDRILRSVGERDLAEAFESTPDSEGALALSFYLRSVMSESPPYEKIVNFLDQRSELSAALYDSAAGTLRAVKGGAGLAAKLAGSFSPHVQAHALEYVARTYKKSGGKDEAFSPLLKKILLSWNENPHKSTEGVPPAILVSSFGIMYELGMISKSDLHSVYEGIFAKGLQFKKSVFKAMIGDPELFEVGWLWRTMKVGDPFSSWVLFETRDEKLLPSYSGSLTKAARESLLDFEKRFSGLGYFEILKILMGASNAALSVEQLTVFLSFLMERAATQADLECCRNFSFKLLKTLEFAAVLSPQNVRVLVGRLLEIEILSAVSAASQSRLT